VSNYTSGHTAEKRAAKYLHSNGFKIHELNWKTRLCEIDIVAEKDKVVYLVEVKYRRTASQGRGVDYITPRKLKQMHFAAEMWVQNQDWQGDYRLAVVTVDGEQIEFLDEL
jgi:Holliday junction resolvase-like predicted endonuclease